MAILYLFHPNLVAAKDSRNISIHTQGAMRKGPPEKMGGVIQVRGKSEDILMSLILVQMNNIDPDKEPLFIEELDGKEPVSVMYPDSLSIYKQGEIDDTKMFQ